MCQAKIAQMLKGQKSRKLTSNVMKYYTAHAVNVVKNYCNRQFHKMASCMDDRFMNRVLVNQLAATMLPLPFSESSLNTSTVLILPHCGLLV